MRKQHFKYKHFEQAVVRTPLFPLEALRESDEFINSDEFRGAILVASPALFRAANSPSKNLSLYKYFLRSSTRCTPFGLFAGCSCVPVAKDHTHVQLSVTGNYHRYTRLDMQYLCALIRDIESNPDTRPQLHFHPNDTLYSIAGQLRYVEYRYKNARRTHQISSIGRYEYVEKVLNAAKESLKPSELAALLVDGEIELSDALEFVNEMIDNQVLVSELDPAVVGGDVLSVLIAKLQRIGEKDITTKLVEIQNKLADMDSRPIGSSLYLYDDIVKIIKSIGVGYEEKFLFQTDMSKPVVVGGISETIVDDIGNCLIFLGKISGLRKNESLKKFKADFYERYEHEEVPLSVALDDELGVGYPKKNGNNDIDDLVGDLIVPGRSTAEIGISASEVDIVLLKKYIEATGKGESVIYVEESDFRLHDHVADAWPDTCGVMCSIMEGVEGGSIIHLKSAGSGGTKLLGRFCHIDDGILGLVKYIAAVENDLKSELLVAEVSHLPESRIGNISSRPVFRDTLIHYLSNVDEDAADILDISDLMLSVRNDRLFLRSVRHDKEVAPHLSCAHNHSSTPIPVYRFLCDLEGQNPMVSLHLGWGELFRSFDYTPRIQYKNIVLSRQRWTISKDEFKDCYKMSDDDLVPFFESFMSRRKLIPIVVLPEGDNEMYIDRTNLKCLKLFLYIAKNKPKFEVLESLFSEYGSVVLSDSGRYNNEFIIAFHK